MASPAPPAAPTLPPSWRKVPSNSRPGEFSYTHLPTGYTQAFLPERDELPEEVTAMLKRQTFMPFNPLPKASLPPAAGASTTATPPAASGAKFPTSFPPAGANGGAAGGDTGGGSGVFPPANGFPPAQMGGSGAPPAPTSEEGRLPPDWTEHSTPDRRIYFYNPKTGQTVWERPQAVQAAAAVPTAAPSARRWVA